MKIRIIRKKEKNTQNANIGNLPEIYEKGGLLIAGTGMLHKWINKATNDEYIIFGHIVGIRRADGTISPSSSYRIETDILEDFQRVSEIEGRFVIIKIFENGSCQVWADQFGRVDIYIQELIDSVVLSTGIDLLPLASDPKKPMLDFVGLAHSLTVYGSRPAKQHTLYQSVSRLGVNQSIQITQTEIILHTRKTKLSSTVPNYTEQDLNRYSNRFIEAIRARASNNGNVVYLSSGWDSTSILATLVHLFGNKKVRAVIGRMRYSDRSGVINQYELDRAHAIADYYGVRLDVIELDYRNNAANILEKLHGLFKSQQFSNLTGFNHWLLAEGTAKTSDGDEVVFAGEISDGAHNLGFSQFVSIFHPASFDFREYSDKMASYLFGPTFMEQIENGKHEADPVWSLFKERNNGAIFESVAQGKLNIRKQLLTSFFLRNGRIPLYSLENTKILTPAGRSQYDSTSQAVYLNEIASQVDSDNLYAAYLHLYNSFHWQGSTVSTLEHTAEAHGLKCAIPFHDSSVIEFLSAMPESWGRGLDLKSTKYPLKWMLKNRIDYPYHLQVGPHSYLYDVNPAFTHAGEILYASSFVDIFKTSLKSKRFINQLDAKMFDCDYINSLINRYLNGEELIGKDQSDLMTLSVHSLIGTYGE
ncbi:hypothetical protein G9409_01320 [Chlorobium sp. BLA1]|uniref:asparagine synthase-related protein n=1 Tax=Candidatus Chlorobium masyuteum TaxID=2716876 RepID=UPI00141DC679|nr:asparagine synthase-related protein [Candidatus Chlorobium masyuteum]NHQ59242.1 hypothetical protein [Candidatus Chlorobium masyuteum]